MTREEAIKVVRNIYQTDAEKEALETLIPELRESEDERIRKVLINYFKGSVGLGVALNGVSVKDIVAYLEKQKAPNARQRLAEWSKTEEGKAKYEEVAKEMREEMGEEQKPEDRFEEAREKYQVEWSEEDEKIKKAISYAIAQCTHSDNTLIEGITKEEALAYIDRQYSAKWSEEDEKMRCNILNALTPNLVYSCGKGTSTGTSIYKYDEEIRWLKSLRPSWKPTEEQMKALSEAVSTFDGYEESDAIKSLYNDLAKLKGVLLL